MYDSDAFLLTYMISYRGMHSFMVLFVYSDFGQSLNVKDYNIKLGKRIAANSFIKVVVLNPTDN